MRKIIIIGIILLLIFISNTKSINIEDCKINGYISNSCIEISK